MSLLDGLIGSGNGSVTVKTDGVELPKRAKVNFTSDGSIDVDGADASDTSNVTLKHANTGGGSLHTKAGTSAGFVAALSAGKNCFTPTCTNSASTYDSHTFTRREVNVASYLPITSDFVSAVHAARDELQRLNAADAGVSLSLGKRGGRIIFPQGDYVATTKIDFEGWTGLELHAVGGAGYTCQTRIIWSAVPAGHTTTGSSTSSRTIASSGTFTFNIGAGQYVRSNDVITFTASGGSITGVVQQDGYNSVSGDVSITATSSTGSGTFASWTWATRNKDYLLSFRSTLTCSMQGIAIIKPPSAAGFVGNAVDCGHGLTGSDGYQFSARRCTVFGWDATEDTSVAFYMGGATSFIIEQCIGLYGGYGVRASNGPGLISISFFGEYQQWATEVGGFTMAVVDCTFEPRNYGAKAGQQCGVRVRTGSPNVTISRCYFGDSTATSRQWILTGARCTNIEYCFFNGGVGSYCVQGYGERINFIGNSMEGGIQRVFADGTAGDGIPGAGDINQIFCAGNYNNVAHSPLSSLTHVSQYVSLDYGSVEFSLATIRNLFVEWAIYGTKSNLVCGNAANNNLSPSTFIMSLTGPTAAFSLDGLAHPGSDGQFAWLEYRGAQQLTIKHLSGAAVGAPFRTATGADIVYPANAGGSVVRICLCFMTDSWVVLNTPTRASHLLNDSTASGTTVKDALDGLVARKRYEIVWGANNDNSAANGWPVVNGNCVGSANNGSEVAAIVRVKAGSVLSDLRCQYTNANPANGAAYTVRVNGNGNTTMADTAITCSMANATINGVAGGLGQDTTHTVTVPDSGDGWGYVSLHKTGSAFQSSNYAGTFTLLVTEP